MDTCVPNANLLCTSFAPSPLSFSIYEQDRPNGFCDNSKLNFNVDIPDDSYLLDSNYEDTPLENVLTPEILSSMASSSSTAAVAPLSTFQDLKAPMEDSLTFNQNVPPTFSHIEMDSEMLFSDFFSIDSNDSKFSLIDFDCMTSNPPSSCHTPVPTSDTRTDLVEPSLVSHNRDVMPSSVTNTDNNGQKFSMKSNFPPRKSEPPVVVVAPIKKDERVFDQYPVKVEMKDESVDKSETSPQTVPSFVGSIKRTEYTPVKMESEIPPKRECLKRSSAEDKWESFEHRIEGDSFTSNKSKRRRCDSGSSGITSEDGDADENDNELGFPDYDSDDDNSDLDADLAHMKPGGCESLIGGGKKQKQYFWQYNVQAKGPKGTRLKLAVESPSDPHVLNGFEDPVFDEGNTTVAGIRHGGKARKGDGNEVTPNPHKLFKIGHQLLRLNKKINGCQLGSDVPLPQRNEARKEKNKLASRACRLKKKAQHEANKIKLHGLEMEHGQINNVLRLLWPELRERAKCLQNEHHVEEKPLQEDLFDKLNGYIKSNLKSMVAGHTTDYVNDVIMTVEKGDLSGGLKVKSRKT